MGLNRLLNWLVLGGAISALVLLIGISEYFNLGYTNAIEAAGGILFSGLLVLLYSRQTEILNKQEELMEHQNRMMMEDHRPQLVFNVSGFEAKDDIANFNVKNVGPGTAFDIGLEIEINPRIEGHGNPISYGRVVDVDGTEPASLGVLRASDEKKMNFEICLPNPIPEADEHPLPVSEALSEFDYSHFNRPMLLVKARYSDVRGKDWGGTVIEQVAFAVEEIDDVEELWTYGREYQNVENISSELG